MHTSSTDPWIWIRKSHGPNMSQRFSHYDGADNPTDKKRKEGHEYENMHGTSIYTHRDGLSTLTVAEERLKKKLPSSLWGVYSVNIHPSNTVHPHSHWFSVIGYTYMHTTMLWRSKDGYHFLNFFSSLSIIFLLIFISHLVRIVQIFTLYTVDEQLLVIPACAMAHQTSTQQGQDTGWKGNHSERHMAQQIQI